MAVQNPYLTTDGDINQAKRKRAGESMAIDAVPNQTSFDVTNTPAARVQAGYSANPMIRQFQASNDRGAQNRATRQAMLSDNAQQTIARTAGGATDAAMQAGAVRNAQAATGTVDRSNPAQEPYPGAAALQNRSASLGGAVVTNAGRDAINSALTVQPRSVPGNPARAAQMQAQFNQPVSKGSSPLLAVQPAVGGGSGDQRPAIAGDSAGLQRMIGGSLSIAPAAIWEGAKNLGADLQNTAYSLIDAEPVPRPGYPRTTQLAQEIAGGASAFSDANSNLLSSAKGGARDLVGAKQAPQPATPQQPASPTAATASSGPAAAAPKPEAAAPIKTTANPANPTVEPVPESPYFATGTDQIAARMNGSTPEFTNDPTAVAGARAMPAGGRGSPLLAPGVSNMADDVPLAQRGSINNIGNGIGGGLSVGAPGDAALALGRFERANQERAKMIEAGRGGVGDSGRVIGIKDSSRPLSRDDRIRAKVDLQQAQAEDARSKTQQSIMAGADELMTNQLNRQKTQQEIEAGRQGQETQQRIADLRAQLANTSLPVEQRQAAEQAYSALTLSPADRYMTVQGGTNEFGGKDASKVFDRLTGREVGENPQSAQLNSDLEQARRIIASDPAKRAEIEKRLQQAYGRGLDG